MDHLSILSLLPPLGAIALAIMTRQVYVSLFLGIWLGCSILAHGNMLIGLQAAIDACIAVFQDAQNTEVIMYCALVGALMLLTQRSGGIQGFTQWVLRHNIANTPRKTTLLSWAIGVIIFVETSITALVNGMICRSLFDRHKLSREKLAYFCDTTSAPICSLIPLNAWGAYIMILLARQHVSHPLTVLLASIPVNFYALLSVLFSLMLAVTQFDFGPMKTAEQRAKKTDIFSQAGAKDAVNDAHAHSHNLNAQPNLARNFLIPIFIMITMIFLSLLITGHGHITQGNGALSVLWSVITSVVFATLYYAWQGIMTAAQSTEYIFKGIGELMPLAILMMLAFALGDICLKLHTGLYLAGIAQYSLTPSVVPAIVFVVSAMMSFSTGTSFGTFGIMIPIAVPIASALQVPDYAITAAVISGGVFGDHCSPISDSTLISSIASECNFIEHVRTQLPYALTVGIISMILFYGLGVVIS